MPKRSKQCRIDRKGRAVLEKHLADIGALNQLGDEDNGTDYEFEVFGEGGQSTGGQIHIQLKSTESPKCRQEHISFPLDIDHLEYYWKRDQLPYFLILIDVENEQGYWIHIQDYLLKHPYPEKSPDATYTIKIPYSNILSDSGVFLAGIDFATAFMVTHKVRLEEWRLARECPGNSFKIDVIDGVRVIKRTGPPIELSTDDILNGKPDLQRDFLVGQDVKLEFTSPPSWLTDNYPFLQDQSNEGKYQLKFSSYEESDCMLIASAVSESVNQYAGINFNGKIRRGQKGFIYSGEQLAGPLKIAVELDATKKPNSPVRITISYSLSPWASNLGRQIPLLTENIEFFRRLIGQNSRTKLQFISNQFQLEQENSVDEKLAESSGRIYQIFTIIREGALVSQRLGISPTLKTFRVNTLRQIQAMHDIIIEGKPFGPHIHISSPTFPIDSDFIAAINDGPGKIGLSLLGIPLTLMGTAFIVEKDAYITNMIPVESADGVTFQSTPESHFRFYEDDGEPH